MKTRRPVRSLVSSTLWVTRLDNFGSAWSDTSMMMSMDEYRILEEAGFAFLPAAGTVTNNGYLPGGTLSGLCINRDSDNSGTYDGRAYYWTRDYVKIWFDSEAGIAENGTLFTMENGWFQIQEWNKNTYATVRLFMPVPTSSTNN